VNAPTCGNAVIMQFVNARRPAGGGVPARRPARDAARARAPGPRVPR